MYYILNDLKEPIKVESFNDVLNWLSKDENADLIAFDEVEGVGVSTRLVVMPTFKTGEITFQTEISVSGISRYLKQYSTREEAIIGHERFVKNLNIITEGITTDAMPPLT